MPLRLSFYGDPILRKKGAEIVRVDDAIRVFAREMIETMHAHRGVGLAAQQVGRALMLCVVDVRNVERPSQLFVGGCEVPVESLMPIVLINPRLQEAPESEEGVEGCLSFPGLAAPVPRSPSTQVSALGLEGRPLALMATGFLARAIQHEVDHLNGVLFIDRMTPEARKPLEPDILRLERATKAELKKSRRRSAKPAPH
ncbi:MAG: peptide deformylase [Verrucomicrobiae bacterium]|nr:peptide deformylase [Verrucomicrobiae bacterium]